MTTPSDQCQGQDPTRSRKTPYTFCLPSLFQHAAGPASLPNPPFISTSKGTEVYSMNQVKNAGNIGPSTSGVSIAFNIFGFFRASSNFTVHIPSIGLAPTELETMCIRILNCNSCSSTLTALSFTHSTIHILLHRRTVSWILH